MKYTVLLQESLMWSFEIEAPEGLDRASLEEIAWDAWCTDEVQDRKEWVDGDAAEIVGIDANPQE